MKVYEGEAAESGRERAIRAGAENCGVHDVGGSQDTLLVFNSSSDFPIQPSCHRKYEKEPRAYEHDPSKYLQTVTGDAPAHCGSEKQSRTHRRQKKQARTPPVQMDDASLTWEADVIGQQAVQPVSDEKG